MTMNCYISLEMHPHIRVLWSTWTGLFSPLSSQYWTTAPCSWQVFPCIPSPAIATDPECKLVACFQSPIKLSTIIALFPLLVPHIKTDACLQSQKWTSCPAWLNPPLLKMLGRQALRFFSVHVTKWRNECPLSPVPCPLQLSSSKLGF